jgi:hypothetical protein
MIGTVWQVPSGLSDAVVVVVDAGSGDDVVDIIEAKAQLAQFLYVRLVALDGGAGYLDRVVEHGARFRIESGPTVVLRDALGENRVPS